jgi:CRP-like cAMP-binding protein
MLAQDSFQPYPETRFASRQVKGAISVAYTPRQNDILAALPAREYERLLPALEPVVLPRGSTIYGAGDRERHLYFITAGLVARLSQSENGTLAGLSVTGREGVIGMASFLGGGSTPTLATALVAGHAYRLPVHLVEEAFRHDGALMRLLLHYLRVLVAHLGQNAACSRHHSLEQRLCRCLLACWDRLGSNELPMTHELISHVLGVRREGVTEVAGRLQQAGLIHCSRGHTVVVDRAALEARVCECYAVIKREYGRLLPNAGKPKTRLAASFAAFATAASC